MKSKETVTPKTIVPAPQAQAKGKSLRPMRSLVAVRSLRPKTAVATMIVKPESSAEG